MLDFHITVRKGSPDQVTITGDVDLATSHQIDTVLSGLSGDIRVDCTEVEFIDSAGFHALDRGYEAARQRGTAFAVAGLNGFSTRIAEFLALPYLVAG